MKYVLWAICLNISLWGMEIEMENYPHAITMINKSSSNFTVNVLVNGKWTSLRSWSHMSDAFSLKIPFHETPCVINVWRIPHVNDEPFEGHYCYKGSVKLNQDTVIRVEIDPDETVRVLFKRKSTTVNELSHE